MASGEVFLWREEEIHHELDDLSRGEVFPGLLVGLLRTYPNEFLEDVTHLHVVHAVGREIDGGELFDDEIEQVLLGHLRNLNVEPEPFHDRPNIRRKAVDVAVEIRRELVRVVEEARQIELREIVERHLGNLRKPVPDDILSLRLDFRVLL